MESSNQAGRSFEPNVRWGMASAEPGRTTGCGAVRTGAVRVARLADFLGLRPPDTGDTHVTVMTS